jgi:hypothetical protein
MEKRINIPDQRNYEQALAQALEIARLQLASSDITELCRRSGAKLVGTSIGKAIQIEYLGKDLWITPPLADVVNFETGEQLPPRERLLVLHYLLVAKGTGLAQRQITLKEIPDGLNYYSTFTKRALKPLIDNFGQEQARLIEAAGKMGGRKAEYGDVSAVISAFPHVPLTFVLWRGDEEFPAAASILFDSSITEYLAVEDVIVLSEVLAWRLVRFSN